MTRTHDLLITNQLLYRLSYTSINAATPTAMYTIAHLFRFVKNNTMKFHGIFCDEIPRNFETSAVRQRIVGIVRRNEGRRERGEKRGGLLFVLGLCLGRITGRIYKNKELCRYPLSLEQFLGIR